MKQTAGEVLGYAPGMCSTRKFWNWEVLKCYFTHSLWKWWKFFLETKKLKEVKTPRTWRDYKDFHPTALVWLKTYTTSSPHSLSLATALTVPRPGKSTFSHVPKNLCFPLITLYNLLENLLIYDSLLFNEKCEGGSDIEVAGSLAGGWHLIHLIPKWTQF